MISLVPAGFSRSSPLLEPSTSGINLPMRMASYSSLTAPYYTVYNSPSSRAGSLSSRARLEAGGDDSSSSSSSSSRFSCCAIL